MPSIQVTKPAPQASLKRKCGDDTTSSDQPPTKKLLSMFAWLIGTHETDQQAETKKCFLAKIDKLHEEITDIGKSQDYLDADLFQIFDDVTKLRWDTESEIAELQDQVSSLEDTVRILEESNTHLSRQVTRIVKAAGSFVENVSNATATHVTDFQHSGKEKSNHNELQDETSKAGEATDNDTEHDGEVVDGDGSEAENELN